MSKKILFIEIASAVIMAVLVTLVLSYVATIIGANFMTDFTLLGNRGYEATGIIGTIFGLPVGGILGAYLVRRKFGVNVQRTSEAILVGLSVGAILLALFFANQAQQNYDQLNFYAGQIAIESKYPEFKNMDCFATCSYKYKKEGPDYYFAYIVNGSGVPIAKATCFKFDKDFQVTKVGEFPNTVDSYYGYQDIDPKNCSGIK
jgi:hypothetical protein